MRPGDRLLCCFIENHLAGNTFSEWPLHSTIVPWFRSSAATRELADALKARLASTSPFKIVIGGEAGFGYHGRKLVNLIESPTPLEYIEKEFREILHARDAWIVDETTKIQRQFLPHVTVLGSNRVHAGDTINCSSLYIVEQKGDYKETVGSIYL